MSFREVAKRLSVDFPDTPIDELQTHVEEFIDLHIENLEVYPDYEEQFSDLIEAGLLPKNKYALLEDTDKEKYLEIWDLDFIVEYIEDVKEFDLALQKRKQPDSGFARLWSYIKAALWGSRP
tara:strand:+ start:358 stop:723 length:366 start_codon:yes stop_codon:yes gene_type:complete